MVREGLPAARGQPAARPEVSTAMVANEAPTISVESRTVKHMAGVLQPDAVARTIVRGVSRRRFMVIPGWRARFLYAVHLLSFGTVTRAASDLVIRRLG